MRYQPTSELLSTADSYHFNEWDLPIFLKFYRMMNSLFLAGGNLEKSKIKSHELLFWRISNAIQLLNKSYFDEFSFVSYGYSGRLDNFMRLVFCWFGIDSILLTKDCGEETMRKQMKRKLPIFIEEFRHVDMLKKILHSNEKRSAYVHANPRELAKHARVKNEDVNFARDVLKRLIIVFMGMAKSKKLMADFKASRGCKSEPSKFLATQQKQVDAITAKFKNNFPKVPCLNIIKR